MQAHCPGVIVDGGGLVQGNAFAAAHIGESGLDETKQLCWLKWHGHVRWHRFADCHSSTALSIASHNPTASNPGVNRAATCAQRSRTPSDVVNVSSTFASLPGRKRLAWMTSPTPNAATRAPLSYWSQPKGAISCGTPARRCFGQSGMVGLNHAGTSVTSRSGSLSMCPRQDVLTGGSFKALRRALMCLRPTGSIQPFSVKRHSARRQVAAHDSLDETLLARHDGGRHAKRMGDDDGGRGTHHRADGRVDLRQLRFAVGQQRGEALLLVPHVGVLDDAQVLGVGAHAHEGQTGALQQPSVEGVGDEGDLAAQRPQGVGEAHEGEDVADGADADDEVVGRGNWHGEGSLI